jgi:hypothetical protein
MVVRRMIILPVVPVVLPVLLALAAQAAQAAVGAARRLLAALVVAIQRLMDRQPAQAQVRAVVVQDRTVLARMAIMAASMAALAQAAVPELLYLVMAETARLALSC